MIDVEKQYHYDHAVWTEVVMDKLRKEKCLCLNCDNMIMCEQAHQLYELCKECNIALTVTRCPAFYSYAIFEGKDNT